MKYYKVIDNDGLGTFSWTHKHPMTKKEIRRTLIKFYHLDKDILSLSRVAYITTNGGSFKTEELLKVYNLELVMVKA